MFLKFIPQMEKNYYFSNSPQIPLRDKDFPHIAIPSPGHDYLCFFEMSIFPLKDKLPKARSLFLSYSFLCSPCLKRIGTLTNTVFIEF